MAAGQQVQRRRRSRVGSANSNALHRLRSDPVPAAYQLA